MSSVRLYWIPFAFVVGCDSNGTPAPPSAPSPSAATTATPLRETIAAPNASIVVEARRWTDVVTDRPDPVEQQIEFSGGRVTWTARGARPLELTAADRDALLAAATRSIARPPNPERAFEGRYVTVRVQLPTGSPATLEMLRILDGVRARYVASRIAEARTMTLELHGHRRNSGNEWEPWQLTVTRDGKVPEISPTTQLDDANHVAVLDWASRLPSERRAPTSERAAHPPPRGIDAFTLTGTLTLGTTSHPVVVELGPPPDMDAQYTDVELEIYKLWQDNRS
jgi:hypothetical protein